MFCKNTSMIPLYTLDTDNIVRVDLDLSPGTSNCRIPQWIRGHALVNSQDYANAVMTFRLDRKDSLKDNVYMITSIARALFLDGHYKQALSAFQKVR